MIHYFGNPETEIRPPFSTTPRNLMFARFRKNTNGKMIVNRFRFIYPTDEWICDGTTFAIS